MMPSTVKSSYSLERQIRFFASIIQKWIYVVRRIQIIYEYVQNVHELYHLDNKTIKKTVALIWVCLKVVWLDRA